MGRLFTIEKLVNQIVPQYSNLHLIPRGLPFYNDKLLRGRTRFSRRTGPTLAVINPDTFHEITVEALQLTQVVTLSRISQWLTIGSIINIGPGLEFNVIDDINVDNKQLLLQFTLAGNHQVGEKVQLFATPIIPSGPALKGATIIHVFSNYDIVNGDAIVLLRNPTLLNSLVELNVKLAELIGPSGNPDFPHSYRLTLTAGIPVAMDLDTNVYLQANAGYVSLDQTLPTNPLSINPLGPVLIDYISGMLRDNPPIRETMSLQAFDSVGNPVVGTNISAQTSGKNFPITQVPIPADFVLFWNKIAGILQYGTDRKVRLQLNSDGHFAIYTEVWPPMPPGTKWKIPMRADNFCTIRFRFGKENPYQDVPLGSGADTNVIVGTNPTDAPVDEIEIVAFSAVPNTTIIMGNWQVDGNEVRTVRFSLSAHAEDEAQWQGTGMIIKPYFLSLDYVRLRFNNNQIFNGGAFFL